MPVPVPLPTERLRELQARLFSIIVGPGRAEAGRAQDWVAAPPRGTVQARLAVHVEGYPARVHEALAEIYPAVFHLIGHRESHALVGRHLGRVACASHDIGEEGNAIPELLRTDPLAGPFPFLADLAALELALARAFHSQERSSITHDQLASRVDSRWEACILEFQPSVSVVRSAWPVRQLWEARETPLDEIDLEVEGCPESVLIRRAGLEVCCDRVDDLEAGLLASLQAGLPLGRIDQVPEAQCAKEGAIAGWFSKWMSLGLLVGCRFSPGESEQAG